MSTTDLRAIADHASTYLQIDISTVEHDISPGPGHNGQSWFDTGLVGSASNLFGPTHISTDGVA